MSTPPVDEEGIFFDTNDVFEWKYIVTNNQFNWNFLAIDSNEVYFSGSPYAMKYDGKSMSNLSSSADPLSSYHITGNSKDNLYFSSAYITKNNSIRNKLLHWNGKKFLSYENPDSNIGIISDLILTDDNSVYIGQEDTCIVYKFHQNKFHEISSKDTSYADSKFFVFDNQLINVQYKYSDNKRNYNLYNIYNNKSNLIFNFSGNDQIFLTKDNLISRKSNLLYAYNINKLNFLFSLKLQQYKSVSLKPDLVAGNMRDSIFILNSSYPYGIYSKLGSNWSRTYNSEIFLYLNNYYFDRSIYFLKNTLFINCTHPINGTFFLIGKLKK